MGLSRSSSLLTLSLKHFKMVRHSEDFNLPSNALGVFFNFCSKHLRRDSGVLSDVTSLRAREQESGLNIV